VATNSFIKLIINYLSISPVLEFDAALVSI
jgi:hypothetical protein